jgi:hypothetical protein
MTDAHDQMATLHILSHIPEHEPRESDPHYSLFLKAKARIHKLGLYICAINDDLCGGILELHHQHVEFSQINSTDSAKVEKLLGLNFDSDEQFQEFIESPGNLEVLCVNHHRTHYGVHVIPSALWETLRFRAAGTKPTAEFIAAKDLPNA